MSCMLQTTDIVATETEASSEQSQVSEKVEPKKRTFLKKELVLLFCVLCIWVLKSLGVNLDNAKATVLEQTVKISPNSASSHFFLGNAYSNLEDYEKAIDAYKAAIRIDPGDADVYRHLAGCYGTLGLHEEEIGAYRQVSRIDPHDAKAYSLLAVCYIKTERYDDAAEVINSLLRLDLHDAYRLFVVLAVSCSRSGHYEKAIEACNQAIEIHPNIGTIHYILVEAYLKEGNMDMALDEYGTLKTLDEELAEKFVDENPTFITVYADSK